MTKFEFQPFDKVLVRDSDKDVWGAAFYSHRNNRIPYPNRTIGDIGWVQCIPYNETTKHLCGTSDPYIDPTEFEVGDTVRFQYTECTTECGEVVGVSGDTFQVSVFGGVYSVDRKRLTLVRKGEKKADTPAEAPAFEFGDVVENTITKVHGIFSRNDPDGAEVFWKGSITTTTCDLDDLRLIRKGNFND